MNELFVPFDSPMNDFQRSLIRKPYNESGLSRAIAYVRETDDIARSILSPAEMFDPPPEIPASEKSAMNSMLTLTAAGVGFEVGVTIAALATEEAVAAVAGPLIFGAGMGAALASLALFEGVVICTRIIQISQSPAYQAWKARRVEIMKDKAVFEFLKQDQILCHFLCPITGEIPLLPSKTRFDITYDYEAAVQWIRQNPGKPLPGSTEPSTTEELRFDYGHINSICTRLSKLQTIVRNETQTVESSRLRLVNQIGNDALRWIAVADVLVQRGDLTRGEAFFGHGGLEFTQKLDRQCGYSYAIGNSNRRAEYSREWEVIRRSPENRNQQQDLRNQFVEAKIEALSLRANVLRKVYRVALPHQDNGFVSFWRKVFFINPYYYVLRDGYDIDITALGQNGWALGIDLRSMNYHGD
jgi:hypothetical protein